MFSVEHMMPFSATCLLAEAFILANALRIYKMIQMNTLQGVNQIHTKQ